MAYKLNGMWQKVMLRLSQYPPGRYVKTISAFSSKVS
jgi:hypothetical protein